jgi:hypothetical protein
MMRTFGRNGCRTPYGAIVLLTAVLLRPVTFAQEVRAPEYNVKAGYLLLFARYVHWPDHAFASDDAPLVIAVLGDDPFGDVLADTLRDQRVGARPVSWTRLREINPSDAVHVVFIAGRQSRDEGRWLNALRDRPVLRVCESAESLGSGAIVRFVEERGRIRFDVDYAAAVASHLRLLTPMLVSAREVRGAPEGFREAGDVK